MKKLSVYIGFVTLLIFSSSTYGQPSEHKFSVEALKEDLQILKKNLKRVHAGLYTYTSEEKMDVAFDSIGKSISEPMTSIEFYRRLTPLLKLIANGHTNIIPSAVDLEATKEHLFQFPLDVHWYNEHLYVLRNGSDDDLVKTGQIIKSINGESAQVVFKYLMDNQLRDGHNLTLPARRVMNGFRTFYTYFKGSQPFFDVELLDSGSVRKVHLKGLKAKEIQENILKRYGESPKTWGSHNEEPLQLTIEKEIATMSVRTFSNSRIKSHGQRYRKFFNESFKEIESNGIDYLILDLRGNDGGNGEIAIELFSHLYKEPVSFYREVFAIARQTPGKAYDEKVLLKDFKKEGDIFRYDTDRLDKRKPVRHLYEGNLYVLTDAYSFSATGFLAGMIKNYERGVFIGEEPGGNSNQNTSGPKPRLTLPHSKISVTVPFIFFKTNVDFENEGHGVKPDYFVSPTVDNILKGEDVVMNFARNLAVEQRERTESP